MPDQLNTTVLFSSPSVLVSDVRCRPGHPLAGLEECASLPTLAFVRGGIFIRHDPHGRAVADANQMLTFRPGEPFHVSHPVPGGDDCTSISFRNTVVSGGREMDAPDGAADAARFPRQTLSGSGLTLLLQGLRRILQDRSGGEMEIEGLCLEVLRRALTDPVPGKGPDQGKTCTRAFHRRTVDNTRMLLASDHSGRHSLSSVGRAMGCSPYHLARIFRRETGLTVHRYLSRLRLRAALERLADRPAGLTAVALDCGFSSHAHFTGAFHREFGITPTAFLKARTSDLLCRLSRILEA